MNIITTYGDKGEAYVSHYDDGKEKWQSHETSLTVCDGDNDQMPFDFTEIRGYGETAEDSYQDFIEKFLASVDQINAIAEKLRNNEIDFIEVDCTGHIIGGDEVADKK